MTIHFAPQTREKWSVSIDRARKALEVASTMETVTDVRNKAEALRAYAEQAGLGRELVNEFAVLKIRSERKAGSMLCELAPHGGDRRSSATGSNLKELGISSFQSRTWRKLAAIGEDIFEQVLCDLAEYGELTTVAVLRRTTSATPRLEPPAIVASLRNLVRVLEQAFCRGDMTLVHSALADIARTSANFAVEQRSERESPTSKIAIFRTEKTGRFIARCTSCNVEIGPRARTEDTENLALEHIEALHGGDGEVLVLQGRLVSPQGNIAMNGDMGQKRSRAPSLRVRSAGPG